MLVKGADRRSAMLDGRNERGEIDHKRDFAKGI
jgi:hypothetical protein